MTFELAAGVKDDHESLHELTAAEACRSSRLRWPHGLRPRTRRGHLPRPGVARRRRGFVGHARHRRGPCRSRPLRRPSELRHDPRHGVHSRTARSACSGILTRNGTARAIGRAPSSPRPTASRTSAAILMGLFLPTVPDFVGLNTARRSGEAVPARAGQDDPPRGRGSTPTRMRSDALAAIDEWTRLHGFPRPAPPPRGSYEREIEFSMQAYLESLWVPEKREWWTTKGGGMMSGTGRPREFVADLLVGALLAPDAGVRRAVPGPGRGGPALIGGEPRLDAQRFPGRLDSGARRSVGRGRGCSHLAMRRRRLAVRSPTRSAPGRSSAWTTTSSGRTTRSRSAPAPRRRRGCSAMPGSPATARPTERMLKTLEFMESLPRAPRGPGVGSARPHARHPGGRRGGRGLHRGLSFQRRPALAPRRRRLGPARSAVRLPVGRPRAAVPRRREHPGVRGHVDAGLVVRPPGPVERPALRRGHPESGRIRPRPTPGARSPPTSPTAPCTSRTPTAPTSPSGPTTSAPSTTSSAHGSSRRA